MATYPATNKKHIPIGFFIIIHLKINWGKSPKGNLISLPPALKGGAIPFEKPTLIAIPFKPPTLKGGAIPFEKPTLIAIPFKSPTLKGICLSFCPAL
jgi:hypothetical protein